MSMPDGSYGTPFTLEELRLAAQSPGQPYHRALMGWASTRIAELEQALEALHTVGHLRCPCFARNKPDDKPGGRPCTCGTDRRNALIEQVMPQFVAKRST